MFILKLKVVTNLIPWGSSELHTLRSGTIWWSYPSFQSLYAESGWGGAESLV